MSCHHYGFFSDGRSSLLGDQYRAHKATILPRIIESAPTEPAPKKDEPKKEEPKDQGESDAVVVEEKEPESKKRRVKAESSDTDESPAIPEKDNDTSSSNVEDGANSDTPAVRAESVKDGGEDGEKGVDLPVVSEQGDTEQGADGKGEEDKLQH